MQEVEQRREQLPRVAVGPTLENVGKSAEVRDFSRLGRRDSGRHRVEAQVDGCPMSPYSTHLRKRAFIRPLLTAITDQRHASSHPDRPFDPFEVHPEGPLKGLSLISITPWHFRGCAPPLFDPDPHQNHSDQNFSARASIVVPRISDSTPQTVGGLL